MKHIILLKLSFAFMVFAFGLGCLSWFLKRVGNSSGVKVFRIVAETIKEFSLIPIVTSFLLVVFYFFAL